MREYYVMIERDEDGYLVGEVPSLRGCYAQGKTMDELMINMKDVIALCLEDNEDEDFQMEFVGVQRVVV